MREGGRVVLVTRCVRTRVRGSARRSCWCLRLGGGAVRFVCEWQGWLLVGDGDAGGTSVVCSRDIACIIWVSFSF